MKPNGKKTIFEANDKDHNQTTNEDEELSFDMNVEMNHFK